ncbi:phosphatidylserine decarboxylase family protein [Streptomyces sp. FH025]|uniref:phosphatidylserine decarboxylase family protein n=1 Tax=Streptomyces sp. FH025 TaxID=2815937 RepID=UPI001A9D52CE|nr:phosphatidylserine decarboxylase family protein [Streptomyces sp. FH025]MBO1413018.1 phosphatidylserine decarboxylase family protein [Streptomyces sp. FH025]
MALPSTVRAGAWLPSDQNFLRDWLDDLIERVKEKDRLGKTEELKPSVARLRDLINGDPKIYMLFNDMLWQLSHRETPTGFPQVKTVDQLLRLFNEAIQSAPAFNTSGLVGFPINAILNWAMGTQAGFAAFLDDKVNAALRYMLHEWSVYLESPESTYVLNDDPETGWFGEKALAAMPGFAQTFVCDPSAPHYGFTSWDDFFTRRLREGVRPVDTDPAVVTSAAESVPYRLAHDVQLRDTFWLKGQPYALDFMLDSAHKGADEPKPDAYVGGTVYQAFLSALNYHRWHSPVDGTVRAVRNIPGTYYSQTPAALCDTAAPDLSQGYIAHLAARAVVYIEATKPAVGLVGFVAIGMGEVSSCDVTVEPGDRVERGEQIGSFHYGGSSHCLVFGPGVDLDFIKVPDDENVLVNARVATLMR